MGFGSCKCTWRAIWVTPASGSYNADAFSPDQFLYIGLRIVWMNDSFAVMDWIGFAFFCVVSYITYTFMMSSLKTGADHD